MARIYGPATAWQSATTPPPPQPGQGGPNEPGGMTLIGSNDGSVLGGISGQSAEPAFGIAGFGQWFEFNNRPPRIQLVDDPTNPTGSGGAIQIDINQNGVGAIATGRFPGGPRREMYWMVRLFRDGATSDESASKYWYFGMHDHDSPSRAGHFVDTPFRHTEAGSQGCESGYGSY